MRIQTLFRLRGLLLGSLNIESIPPRNELGSRNSGWCDFARNAQRSGSQICQISTFSAFSVENIDIWQELHCSICNNWPRCNRHAALRHCCHTDLWSFQGSKSFVANPGIPTSPDSVCQSIKDGVLPKFFPSSQVLSSPTCTIPSPLNLVFFSSFDWFFIRYTVLGRSFELLPHFSIQFYTRYVLSTHNRHSFHNRSFLSSPNLLY